MITVKCVLYLNYKNPNT